MNTMSARADHTRHLRLTAPLYAYAVCTELILLYPLYTLLFQDTGLSVTQISSLFILWSVTGVLVAVPSGAWADFVPRRYLLATGPLLTGTAFALWTLFPGYAVFALGFVLWGIGGGLVAGTLEALVYTELHRRTAVDRYATVMGITRALGTAAVGVATLTAVPVMAHGGYIAVGAASVAVCVLCSLTGLALPEHRQEHALSSSEDKTPSSYLATLRSGLTEVHGSRSVRGAVVLLIVVSAFWETLEEYVPLLATEAGVATATVPVVVLVVWACITVGGLFAGRAAGLPGPFLGVLLMVAVGAVGVGAHLGTWAGWVLLGAGFAVFQMVAVVADARLQDRITGPGRATVTSLAGMGTETVAILVFASYAGMVHLASHAAAFTLFTLAYLVAGAALCRHRPRTEENHTG